MGNDAEIGLKFKKVIEQRIQDLTMGKTARYTKNNQNPVATVIRTKAYQEKADIVVSKDQKTEVKKEVEIKNEPTESVGETISKKEKKKKKKKKRKIEEVSSTPADDTVEPPRRRRKRKRRVKRQNKTKLCYENQGARERTKHFSSV